MEIPHAYHADLDALTRLEALCFPPAEAAGLDAFRSRLAVYPNHFWLLWQSGHLVSYVNGPVTDQPDLADWMYHDPSVHREHGAWQMIFGVGTTPQSRSHGCAAQVLRQVIEDAARQGRKGLVLTCKDALVPYYARFGFRDEGMSSSQHGGVAWHQMRLTLPALTF